MFDELTFGMMLDFQDYFKESLLF